jgi:hypothetical protein
MDLDGYQPVQASLTRGESGVGNGGPFGGLALDLVTGGVYTIHGDSVTGILRPSTQAVPDEPSEIPPDPGFIGRITSGVAAPPSRDEAIGLTKIIVVFFAAILVFFVSHH